MTHPHLQGRSVRLARLRSSGRARRQGYTLIEVMMATAIMTAGSVGIMAMQQASTRGNTFARQMSVATNVNRTWIERLRTDGLQWNARGAAGLATTNYLVSAPAAGTAGEWMTPPVVAESLVAFDYAGVPTVTPGDMFFCANVRYNWVVNDEALRIEVRTWWPRRSSNSDALVADRQQFVGCAVGAEAGVTTELDAEVPRLHAIQTSTVVRWLPST